MLADGFENPLGYLEISSHQEGVDQLLTWLASQQENYHFQKDQLIIGVEGGGRYRDLLVTSLLKNKYQVYEVNPLYTKQRRQFRPSHDKDDLIDARLIVEVLSRQQDLLVPLSISALDDQALILSHWVRVWEEKARQSARLKNQLQRLIQERETASSPQVRRTLAAILKIKQRDLQRLQNQQKKLRSLLAGYVSQSEASHLPEIKGISIVSAARLMAHLGSIQRFRNLDAFIKYAGLAPTRYSSGKQQRQRVTKSGQRKLNSVFYLIALNQIRWNPLSQAYFRKKLREGKTKRQALRSLSKRLATIIYGVMRSQQAYQPAKMPATPNTSHNQGHNHSHNQGLN